jgi:hypothetical protein
MEEKTLDLNLPITLSDLTRFLIFASLSILSFFVPFSFGHPQWLVGTIVNTCLFLAAVFLSRCPANTGHRGSSISEKLKSGPKKYLYFLPMVILPSLGVLARGIIFGPFTFFLVYLLPFIWLSNLILILTFKALFSKAKYIPSVFFASVVKFLFLFAVANICFNFHLVPKLFLQTMGSFQLLTALSGGLISWIIFKLYGEYNTRNKRIT